MDQGELFESVLVFPHVKEKPELQHSPKVYKRRKRSPSLQMVDVVMVERWEFQMEGAKDEG